MKRFIPFFILLSMAFVFFGSSCSRIEDYKAPQVCLDAGHGGKDSGSSYKGRLEKNDNLSMVLAVKKELEKDDIKVVLTRNGDEFVSLHERSKIANNSGAKFLVSIHRNSGSGANGVEIWINSQNVWADRVLAENIMSDLKSTGISADRGIKAGFQEDSNENYYINENTNIPSCIVEMGFMSSREDNKMFDDDIKEYAKSIARAIKITLKDISED